MVADIRITGAENFKALGARLREQGDVGKGLRRELYKNIDRATKPLRDEVKRAEAAELPHRGGLAALVSGTRISTSKRNTGRTAGIRLTQKGKLRQLPAMDQGHLRHKTFGRPPWKPQEIKSGWWTETLNSSQSQAQVRAAVLAAMEETARKIQH